MKQSPSVMINNPYAYPLKEVELRKQRSRKLAIVPIRTALAAYQASSENPQPAKLEIYA